MPKVLLMVETAGAFGRGLIEGISRYAKEHGPWLIQYQYRALDTLPPEWLKSWRGDGIISRTIHAQQAKLLRKTKLPLVELFGDPKFSPPHITNDESINGRMVVEHFLDCGLRHFGFFSYTRAWWTKVLIATFNDALRERGHECNIYESAAKESVFSTWHESQRPGLIKWLQEMPRPIGIYTPGDLHSVCLLDMCLELGIAVPEEIAIVGRGNDPVICEAVHPTLSSLDLNAARVGYEAAKLLDKMMAGKSPSATILIPPSHLAVRQSTDLVAIEDPDVAQAMRFIRDRACSGIDVPRVVEEVGLSRSVLERRFHRHLGRTPKAEILRVKIEKAKMLLVNTDHSSERIARLSGFASLEYFTTAFRRAVGMKPQAFRKTRVIPQSVINAFKSSK